MFRYGISPLLALFLVCSFFAVFNNTGDSCISSFPLVLENSENASSNCNGVKC